MDTWKYGFGFGFDTLSPRYVTPLPFPELVEGSEQLTFYLRCSVLVTEPRPLIPYDAYGGLLASNFAPTAPGLEQTLANQGQLAEADSKLLHLGQGRWYDPAVGRPLQPNPAGDAPLVPQSLNRYAATGVGQPGVGQGARNGGLPINPSALSLGIALNVALDKLDTLHLSSASAITLRGSLPQLQRSLGKNLRHFQLSGPILSQESKNILSRSRAIPGLYEVLSKQLALYDATLEGPFFIEQSKNLVKVSGLNKLHFSTKGLEVRSFYHNSIRFGDSVVGRSLAALGGSVVLDVGFEFWDFQTGTGQWANPYLTTEQKAGQAFLTIGSNGLLALTLAAFGAPLWGVTIPAVTEATLGGLGGVGLLFIITCLYICAGFFIRAMGMVANR